MQRVNEFTPVGAKNTTFQYDTKTRNPERIHYAQDTIHPRHSWVNASICLILCIQKVSSFQDKNKSFTLRDFTPVLADITMLFLDTKKAWSWMHLLPEGLDCLNTISTDNSRPIRSHDYTTQKCHIAKRCGKQGPVADVSVRLFSAFMKVSSFQEENQSKNSIFALKITKKSSDSTISLQ